MKIIHKVAILFLSMSLSAQAVELNATYWSMTPSGNGSVGSDGQEGTTIDVQDDLGYDNAEAVPSFELTLGQTHQLDVSYFGFNLSAKNTMNKDVLFGDVTYRVNTEVSSSLDATLIRGAYRFNAGSDEVSGGFLVGVQYADISADLSSPDFGSAHESLEGALPVLGGFIKVTPVDWLSLRASLCGGTWDWGDISATFIDGEADALAFHKDTGLFAGAGYRRLSIKGKDDSVPMDVDLVFSGPVLFAGINF